MNGIEGLIERAWVIHTRYLNRETIGEPGGVHDRRFLALAIAGEAGELANIVKKRWRSNGQETGADVEALRKEHADILNYLVLSARANGFDLIADAHAALTEYENRFVTPVETPAEPKAESQKTGPEPSEGSVRDTLHDQQNTGNQPND